MNNHRFAVVGAGIWGKNIVRNFYNLGVLDTVCDIDDDNLARVKNDYPEVNLTKDFNKILENESIEAIAVVTPSHTHFKLVEKALKSGKHVYVEKPISTVADEAKKLMEIADSEKLVLMVGHLLLYHPAVNRLKQLIQNNTLGDITYAQSDRLNINHFKNDRSVMWDLAPHDVSMVNYVLGKEPLRVISAVGASSDNNEIMDITHITVEYDDGVIAHFSDSWIHPQKRVNLLVRGTLGTAIFDDTLAQNKLQVFRKNNTSIVENISLEYIEIEPLKLECQHFISCIEQGIKARSDGENGYNVVKILEEAEKIMLGDRTKKLDNYDFALSRSKKLVL